MHSNYEKPHLTFKEQLSKLKFRGLCIDDESTALNKLSSISYYRLSGYWYTFRQRNNGEILDDFKEGTSFESILQLYDFDCRLRFKVLEALEKIEIKIRTEITYYFGEKYGAFGHLEANNFHPNFNHSLWIEKVNVEISRSKEEYIQHYSKNYNGFPNVPIWMLTEVLSFGALSHFYKGLINNQSEGIEDKKAIADLYGVHYKRLEEWLHTLSFIRNVCAHHGRLWNRYLAIRPNKSKEKYWKPPFVPRSDRIYYVMLIIQKLLQNSGYEQQWSENVSDVVSSAEQSNIDIKAMGFPNDWVKHPLWQIK